jgi:hypothetical protein
VQEHLDHKEVRGLQMRVDESNALEDLQNHIFRSYAEAATSSAFAYIDVERLSSAVHATVRTMKITVKCPNFGLFSKFSAIFLW